MTDAVFNVVEYFSFLHAFWMIQGILCLHRLLQLLNTDVTVNMHFSCDFDPPKKHRWTDPHALQHTAPYWATHGSVSELVGWCKREVRMGEEKGSGGDGGGGVGGVWLGR